jgi:endogenous inhibitor of DNA gyrase (YacG/DUF329 family)
MRELPTERDALPDEAEVEQVECPGCGTAGYIAVHHAPHEDHIPRCESCIREDFREDLADDDADALGVLDRIQSRGLLPFRDPEGNLITEVDVRRGPPGAGSYLRKIVRVVERDCPECGHDRADHKRFNIWTAESGERVFCRVCGHTIDGGSTL